MKIQERIICLGILFCITLGSCKSYRHNTDSGFTAGNVELQLTVDAENLFNAAEINSKKFIESFCALSETIDGEPIKSQKGNLKRFKTDVLANDKINWNAVSNSDGYTVEIVNITPILKRGRDKNFFPKYILEASEGQVNATVKDGKKGKRYPYAIFFTITNEANDTLEFFIDPKLMASN